MAAKLIPELTLIGALTDASNFAIDDGIQSYRATAAQIKDLVLADNNGTTDFLANGSVTLSKLASALQALLVPTGVISAFGGTSAPAGYLLCDGQTVSRTTYAALFGVIGTAFGAGDGSTTFGIPDTKALVLRGLGQQTINGRLKDGGILVGSKLEDQMQKLTGSVEQVAKRSSTGAAGALSVTLQNDLGGSGTSSATRDLFRIELDSANSPDARVSSTTAGETRVSSLGVNYIIKI